MTRDGTCGIPNAIGGRSGTEEGQEPLDIAARYLLLLLLLLFHPYNRMISNIHNIHHLNLCLHIYLYIIGLGDPFEPRVSHGLSGRQSPGRIRVHQLGNQILGFYGHLCALSKDRAVMDRRIGTG